MFEEMVIVAGGILLAMSAVSLVYLSIALLVSILCCMVAVVDRSVSGFIKLLNWLGLMPVAEVNPKTEDRETHWVRDPDACLDSESFQVDLYSNRSPSESHGGQKAGENND